MTDTHSVETGSEILSTAMIDLHIMLINGSDDEKNALKRALTRLSISIQIHDLSDEHTVADNYLEKIHEREKAGDTSIILLGSEISTEKNQDFLRAMHNDERCKNMLAIALTVSDQEKKTRDACQNIANIDTIRIDTLDGTMHIADTIMRFWFKTINKTYIK